MKFIQRIKRAAAVAATGAVALCACVFSSCGGEAKLNLLEENILNDNYGNYYEIFVYSFYDSDGDGYGDLNGVTEKLDYIRDLGYTGIWLMPVCPSPSYHKYDVTDYMAIDGMYGTMDDFETLISKAHKLGIDVITDLVVNHSSSSHPWFKASVKAHLNNDTSNEYYDYYNFSSVKQSGYNGYSSGLGTIYYESRFDSGMPDLNLDCEAVRSEISEIIKFWCEKGVDGFRLDACTSYYTGDAAKSKEFVAWITGQTKLHNPDAFVVGEVWEGASTIKSYYESSPDTSFFCFPASTANGGYIYNTLVSSASADTYWANAQAVVSMAAGGVPAPFLCNHDMNRIAGAMGRVQEKVKFAYGLLSLFNGATFTYYGDEIGMIGSGSDPNRRIGMLWSTGEKTTNAPAGATVTDYAFDGVKQQLADSGSILSYYKMANNIRNAFPEIARGESELVLSEGKLLVFTKTYQGSTVVVAVNFDVASATVEGDYGTLQKGLSAYGEEVSQSGGMLTLPGYSYAILK